MAKINYNGNVIQIEPINIAHNTVLDKQIDIEKIELILSTKNFYSLSYPRDFYRGKSFHFKQLWKTGVWYTSDDYNVDFVVKDNVLLACKKSHLSDTLELDFITDGHGSIIGINSEYWDLVVYDGGEKISKETIIEALGYLPGEIEYGSTEYWNSRIGYIPPKGCIIVYSDYSTILSNGLLKNIPNIKIGSGNGYVQDLVFVGDDIRNSLLTHINNQEHHITQQERNFWNNKINVDDNSEVYGETLIFNRN